MYCYAGGDQLEEAIMKYVMLPTETLHYAIQCMHVDRCQTKSHSYGQLHIGSCEFLAHVTLRVSK